MFNELSSLFCVRVESDMGRAGCCVAVMVHELHTQCLV